ncbi:ankyrin repeat and LEM domain-containing protein 2 homolog [Macrosteles quadrilineatus]|uniref:ankyrin repeat and LEM domain-containing protein 2 homolog n=1 Tax=Macrosteles quadrilineatus TaxID=74068 RepID=UPI0023E0A699|nr:ankyrin repeat and LEM domain-containing protein 2 homolog [Macrosteles quadrilineatus]XP_054262067.1 ankyrin repeat and LEM domain-containing protein 2 homolog [Macrosteles quadrilineatus]XP_054262068.1 ankyrin repeat and LEM domain-containing protein 2 homolog [Macrosteles quadrilineatus]
MGPSPAKPGPDKCSGPSDNVYYGVFLPPDVQPSNEDPEGSVVFKDKSEALKLVKKYKKARFKAFRTLTDAMQFAACGLETATACPTSPVAGEKPSPFRGPKPQDMVRLRKAIEAGDLEWVKKTVWENPRYLVSSGDTPSILQEGPRYNALHIAAKARNAAICAFILETVSNPEFIKHLYGDTLDAEQRCSVLLDLYLNTPEHKAMNETPLHFASKFGAASVVQVLVAYGQCDRTAVNKLNHTAKDVVCSRMPDADPSLKEEILAMLEEQFYVPVLRSPDHSVEATVGKPFSPSSPLQQDEPGEVTSPVLEVQAVAGPMPKQKAELFRRRWKTPPRLPGSPLTPRRPQLADQDKGWERVGRELAQEWKVPWKEYWPFLNTYVDLSSQEGLQLLEEYLRKRFKNASEGNDTTAVTDKPTTPKQINGVTPESPISELCSALRNCSLASGGGNKPPPSRHPLPPRGPQWRVTVHHNGDIPTHVTSPHLYMEKSCQVFAKRIADGFLVGDGDTEFLWVEVKHLNVLVASCRSDNRFSQLDFCCLHARLGQIVAQRLDQAELTKVTDCLRSLINRKLEDCYSSDEDDLIDLVYVRRPRVDRRDRQTLYTAVVCVARAVLTALDNPVTDTPASEHTCADVWARCTRCDCTFPTKHGRRKLASQKKLNFNNDLDEVNPGAGDEVTGRGQGVVSAYSSGEESDTSDTSECEFFTPPSSPGIRSDDDLAMESPDEGPDVYISGNTPSKLDLAVMEAIRGSEISKAKYPNICRWRHLVLLHSEHERQTWISTPKHKSSPSSGFLWHRTPSINVTSH